MNTLELKEALQCVKRLDMQSYMLLYAAIEGNALRALAEAMIKDLQESISELPSTGEDFVRRYAELQSQIEVWKNVSSFTIEGE